MVIADLKYAFKLLVKTPVTTAAGILTLAIGIGAATAVFSVVNGVLLKSLPFPDLNFLVAVPQVDTQTGQVTVSSYADFLVFQKDVRQFQFLAAYHNSWFSLSTDALPENIRGTLVSSSFFSTLGV